MKTLDEQYWSARYAEGKTGWDIGHASPHLIEAAHSVAKDTRILIPGCGLGWEAEQLWKEGYSNIFICDISGKPLDAFAVRVPDFPKSQLLHTDFFSLKARFELILEQTFFCALPPGRRDDYVQKMYDLLTAGGALKGLLFDFPLTEEGPPFGGSESEYRQRFTEVFDDFTIERAQRSIAPRQGKEFYFEALKI